MYRAFRPFFRFGIYWATVRSCPVIIFVFTAIDLIKLITEKIHSGYLSEMLLIFCINNFVQRLLTLYAIIILVFLLWRIFRNLLVTKH